MALQRVALKKTNKKKNSANSLRFSLLSGLFKKKKEDPPYRQGVPPEWNSVLNNKSAYIIGELIGDHSNKSKKFDKSSLSIVKGKEWLYLQP